MVGPGGTQREFATVALILTNDALFRMVPPCSTVTVCVMDVLRYVMALDVQGRRITGKFATDSELIVSVVGQSPATDIPLTHCLPASYV